MDAAVLISSDVGVFGSTPAVIVTVPFVIALTKPSAETVVTSVSDELHVTVTPVMMLPAASFMVGTSVAVSPSEVKLTVVGESVSDAGL